MPTCYSIHYLHVTIIANNSQVLMEDKTRQVPSVAFVSSFYKKVEVAKFSSIVTYQGEGGGQFPTFAEQ